MVRRGPTMRLARWWLVGAFLLPSVASAEVDLRLGGRVQSNIRYRPSDDRFTRNEHIFKVKANAAAERFTGVFDVDLVWLGFVRSTDLTELSLRETAEPVRIEAQAAYVEAVDLFLDGLDFRLGYQIVNWGVADQFNPTNNLNADDLEDRLLFGTQQANLMARVDFAPYGDWVLSGAVVPIFRPALVPFSAPLGIAAIDRLPHLDRDFRHLLHAQAAVGTDTGFPTVVSNAQLQLPATSFNNMQYMVRLGTVVADQDVSLSWFGGRSDFPVPVDNFTTQTADRLETIVTLGFPKMNVLGFNVAGEFDLGVPIGYRAEVGVYFPREQRLAMRQGDITIAGILQPAGEYAYPNGERPLVLADTPYAKWTLGLDYTFNEYVYLNLMWVHGLADELGAGDFISEGEVVRAGGVGPDEDATLSCATLQTNCDQAAVETLRNRLGDYVVAGVDLKFLEGNLLFRLFAILEVTGYVEERFSRSAGERVRERFSPFSSDGFSAVLFPGVAYNFGDGLELSAGALFELGKSYTKFGDPAAGGNVAWFTGKYAF